MEDLEAFKQSRMKIDPSSRDMSDHQWQQSYEAYLRARGRVSGGAESEGSSRKRRRSTSSLKSDSSRGQHQPSSQTKLGLLRQLVRQESAYRDLRLVVDILAWVAVVLVVLGAGLSLLHYTVISLALVAMVNALFKVSVIVLVRLLVQVIIDIPDIALYRAAHEEAK